MILREVLVLTMDVKKILKDDYFLLGKTKFSEEDYIEIKARVKEPYFKRVLKRYATCFFAVFDLIGQVLELFAEGLLVLILGLVFIIFMFITAPFHNLLYWYWYRKIIKQRAQSLKNMGENHFKQESMKDKQ